MQDVKKKKPPLRLRREKHRLPGKKPKSYQTPPKPRFPIPPAVMITDEEAEQIARDTHKKMNKLRTAVFRHQARDDIVQNVYADMLKYCVAKDVYLSEMPAGVYHMLIRRNTIGWIHANTPGWSNYMKKHKFRMRSLNDCRGAEVETVDDYIENLHESGDAPANASRYGTWNLNTTFDDVVTEDMKNYIKIRVNGAVGMTPCTRERALDIFDLYCEGWDNIDIALNLSLQLETVGSVIYNNIQPIAEAAYTSQVYNVFGEDRHVPNDDK